MRCLSRAIATVSQLDYTEAIWYEYYEQRLSIKVSPLKYPTRTSKKVYAAHRLGMEELKLDEQRDSISREVIQS